MLSPSKHEDAGGRVNWKQAALAIIAACALLGAGWLGASLLLRKPPPPPAPKSLFTDWAAIIVAGDWRAHSGAPSQVFDNARHDLAKAFIALGFQPANIRQFTAVPQAFPYENVQPSAQEPIVTGLAAVTARAKAGCMLYLTSHGTPEGIVIGERVVDPAPIAAMVNQYCGDRPTAIIVSACFSGAFVPLLQGPNRIVFTAARADRTSFGCGELDQYTFFDTCVLSQIGKVGSFPALADKVKACVTARETAMHIGTANPASIKNSSQPPELPSEPQFVMDPQLGSLSWR
jgi:hypothetical protein